MLLEGFRKIALKNTKVRSGVISYIRVLFLALIRINSKMSSWSLVDIFNCSFLMPREVYIRALLSGAVAIVLAHNRPSGDTIPSDEDIHATERIGKAGELLGVELLDHIIIGSDGYCSLKDMGVIL